MKRVTPGLVVATVAVVLAGAGGAVAASQITGKQIRNSSITGADVKNKSLTTRDFRGSVRGPAGPQGAPGPTGAQGPAGPAAAGRITEILGPTQSMCAGGGGECQIAISEAACPSGQVITGGGWDYENEPPVNNSVVFSDTNVAGTSWVVAMVNYGDPADMFAMARCVPGTSTPGAATRGGSRRHSPEQAIERARAALR